MNLADYLVLLGVLAAIMGYGIWKTRSNRDLRTYVKGDGNTGWLTIGLSVMATQASAITFLSTPGQGYQNGLGFVQNYFGAPLALIVVAVVFLPIFRRLDVYTAYEYLGRRFDRKTRLLGAGLFLVQRGLGAGITIYAPAIVLSTVFGWRLDLTIIVSGLSVIAYTVSGGSPAVNLTQKYQIGIIFVGMIAAAAILVAKLPPGLGIGGAMAIAGGFHKLNAVDFSLDPDRRYTLWSGVFGGMFLALSYFGTDQSQVQRYLAGSSLREGRLGLMFNAIFKIPMQFFILLLGVFVFVFYQFERPPVFFNEAEWEQAATGPVGSDLQQAKARFDQAQTSKQAAVESWLGARSRGDAAAAEAARQVAVAAQDRAEQARTETKALLRRANPKAQTNDDDYVFIRFIFHYLPHGLIGLLVAAFFAATFSSKAGELNALGSTTTVDIYRHLLRPGAEDAHCLTASKWFTAGWGVVAIGFALFANLSENLIQATNIIGSVFYGVVLGLFLVAFFLKWIGGTAAFWSAIGSQALVFVLYETLPISYLWYNPIGCALCMGFAAVLQAGINLSRSAVPQTHE